VSTFHILKPVVDSYLSDKNYMWKRMGVSMPSNRCHKVSA